MPKKIKSEDTNYAQKKDIYASLVQVFQDYKQESLHGYQGWNKPIDELKGLTMRLIGGDHLELTHHHIETTTVEGLARLESEEKFVTMALKEIKKKFKKVTGMGLKLKKYQSNRSIEKYSQLQSDTSWMLSSYRNGYGARPTGRYLVKDSVVYEFDLEE